MPSGAKLAALAVPVIVVALAALQLLRAAPAPTLHSELATHTAPGPRRRLPWPSGAEATVAVEGIGTLGSSGGDAEIPIASITKVMATLVVLHDHPLTPGAQGPTIPITARDVVEYEQERRAQDSVVAVRAGERLTEYEALEAALVPSADNVMRILARWDAGSTAAFVARMNARARSLGLGHTHYAGPSGVNPATVSTAADETRLAEVAMGNPVIAQIVALPQVTLPVVGVQYNVDADLGKGGIVGVKTGWVPAGGASFVFAAHHDLAGRTETVVGAIVGEQGATPLDTALGYAVRLARAGGSALRIDRVVSAGTAVATLRAPYGSPVTVVTSRGASLVDWRGAAVSETLHLVHDLVAPIARGARVGMLDVRFGTEHESVPLVTASALPGPTLSWRLTRL